jgi:putative flippase GtrA
MGLVRLALRLLPSSLRNLLIKHAELLKFAMVGGTAYLVTLFVNYALKETVLQDKPLTALGIATTLATVVSYVLSREWAFRTRGGREQHHEAALFFLVNAIAVGLNLVPEAFARYVLLLEVPHVTFVVQEVSDFVFEMIIGTLLGTAFRWWGYKKLVFPQADARPRRGRVTALRPEDARHLPESDEVA